jgi:hypothetical protein
MLNLLFIVSLVIWVLRLAWDGAIPMWSAGIVLVALVYFVAAGEKFGIAKIVFRIVFPLASLAALVVWEGKGDPRVMTELAMRLGVLFIALFGLYIIFKGVFSKK